MYSNRYGDGAREALVEREILFMRLPFDRLASCGGCVRINFLAPISGRGEKEALEIGGRGVTCLIRKLAYTSFWRATLHLLHHR